MKKGSSIWIDKEELKLIQKLAKLEGRTMSNQIVICVKNYINLHYEGKW